MCCFLLQMCTLWWFTLPNTWNVALSLKTSFSADQSSSSCYWKSTQNWKWRLWSWGFSVNSCCQYAFTRRCLCRMCQTLDMRHLEFLACFMSWYLMAPDKRFSHMLDSLSQWPQPSSLQRTGSYSAGISRTTHELYCPKVVLCVTWFETFIELSQLTQFWQIPRHTMRSYAVSMPCFVMTTSQQWNQQVCHDTYYLKPLRDSL
jgi:hypothetical protein